ncbi:MAG: preprotein translocase subunit YajC [Clostridia bacterium]|nr:preprotein translocase subunit YajC [Clostridia bacterium]
MTGSNIWVIVILGVFLVAMIVMTIIPQKKRQKQQQEMMTNLQVGTKLMTIGRLVGKIVAINSAENTIILNVGTEENPTLMTIEKNGVGVILDAIKPIEPVSNEVQPIEIEEEKENKKENDSVFEETTSAKKKATTKKDDKLS